MITLTPRLPDEQAQWRNDPSIYKYTRQNGVLPHGAQERWEAAVKLDKSIKMFGIYDDEMRRLVGTCGLTSINHDHRTAEFSLFIGPEWQGEGRGREALKALFDHGFKDMDLAKIWGETFYDNPALILFLKIGMHKEGVLRSHYYKGGTRIDAIQIGILKEEWLGLHP